MIDKAIVFTDIHYGKSQNSSEHLQDCNDYITWLIEQSISHSIDTCIFLGDWHDSRQNIQVKTLNTSFNDLKKLNNHFKNVYFILGNHDLYFRDTRNIHSMPFIRELSNFTIIEKPTFIDDCLFLPWLVGEEWKKIKEMQCKYVFAHVELPGHMMNAMVKMPDHGTLHDEDFATPDYVFSGHFHKRQQKGKIVYIGNPFPHNYADAWDDDRGCMIFERDKQPSFINWHDGPRYRTINLSSLLETPDKYLNDKTYARITIDIDISYEEAQLIKETFQNRYSPRRIDFIHKSSFDDTFEFNEDVVFQTVDQIVINGINEIDSTNINKDLLLAIYRDLNT